MNQVIVNFIPCDPAPASGYNVQWRVVGTSDPYTDAGNFFTSPAVFVDDTNPEGTQYEGIIRSDCSESGDSGTNYGNDIAWMTHAESGESGAGGDIYWDINDQYGANITITDNALNEVLNVNSNGSSQNGHLSSLFGSYTICAKWVSGSGNTIRMRICAAGVEVFYGSCVIGGETCFVTASLPDPVAPYVVYVTAGNIEPQIC